MVLPFVILHSGYLCSLSKPDNGCESTRPPSLWLLGMLPQPFFLFRLHQAETSVLVVPPNMDPDTAARWTQATQMLSRMNHNPITQPETVTDSSQTADSSIVHLSDTSDL